MTSFLFELMVPHIRPADRTNHSCPYNYHRCFNGRLEKYCRQMGIPVKSCHDIRRTAITNLDDAGMPTKALQAFAGHSTEAMTYPTSKVCRTSKGRA